MDPFEDSYQVAFKGKGPSKGLKEKKDRHAFSPLASKRPSLFEQEKTMPISVCQKLYPDEVFQARST